jgi:hypothetical protein
MKTINPVTIWINGESKQATVLYSQVNSDNLVDNATFYYQLFEEVDINISPLVNGTVDMNGADYVSYNSATDANAYAWDWLSSKLNLTITGDYVPPAPPQPESTPEVTQETPVDEAS